MAGSKVYDWNPYNLPKELVEAIGLVNACFAQTQEILQDATAGCAGLDFEYGLAFTTHMPMQTRLDALRAVAEIRIDDLDALDELDEHIAQFELATLKRNVAAHDRWCRDPETGALFTARHSARGTVKGDLRPTTFEQVLADAQFIYETGMRVFVFLKGHNLIPPLVARPSRHHKSKAERKKRRQQK